ncbi:MAG: hypothetical protein Q8N60_01560, partial [Candidatus Diapherotrites archaeon]|nr:hypothetical protein [Candidatus Diapherotrites archaeon]
GNILFINALERGYETPSKSYTFIEFPAKYKPVSKGMFNLSWEVPNAFARYFNQEVDLKATKAANLICQRVLAKVAHRIDSIVKTKEGGYRTPRRPMFQHRKPLNGFRGRNRKPKPK